MKYSLILLLAALVIASDHAVARKHHRHRSARHHRTAPNPFTTEDCPNGTLARRMRLTNYYTPVLAMKCPEEKIGLLNYNDKERKGSVCSQATVDYVVKKMEGAGTVLGPSGQHLGVLVSPKGPLQEILNAGFKFSETPPRGTPDQMVHVSVPVCPLGFGNKIGGKPICLDPFKTVACPPHHEMGEVVYIPATLGIKYPRYPGQIKAEYQLYPGHDGYFACGDIGQAIQGEHIDLFTAFINPYAADNPFKKFSNTKEYGVCWVKAENDPEKMFRFHTATEMNSRFPELGFLTLANYTNEYLLARAFGLGFWAQ